MQKVMFELPLGVLLDGQIEKNVELRPMTGNERVLMANPKFRRNAGALITNLLKACLVSVGGNDKFPPTLVKDMTIGDRDYLLLMLRTISLPQGEVIHINMKCGVCDEPLYVELPVEEIPVRRAQDGDFEVDDKGNFTFELTNDEFDLYVKMRLATGKDQEEISPIMDRNPFLANYRMYQNCLLKWNDEEPPFSVNFLQKQPTKILDWLEKEYRDRMPGPDWNYKIDCVVCGSENTISLANSDFLLPRMES